ncbi:hypothetical protein APHAL10511_008417 [Amanita phalloides]|nr:hypothetical protein APHAL10511_008417 [Amanita phalloides]
MTTVCWDVYYKHLVYLNHDAEGIMTDDDKFEGDLFREYSEADFDWDDKEENIGTLFGMAFIDLELISETTEGRDINIDGVDDADDGEDDTSDTNNGEDANDMARAALSVVLGPAEVYDVERFPGPEAGVPMENMTAHQTHYIYQQQLGSDAECVPFKSQLDWEIVRWAKLHGPSSSAITELLKIEGKLVDALGLSFKNAQELNLLIDKSLPECPCFHHHNTKIGRETVIMYSHNIISCIQSLYGNPKFTTHLIHKPERHYTQPQAGDEQTCVFHDMHTGMWWWQVQMAVESLKPGTTIIPLIIASDRTQGTCPRRLDINHHIKAKFC